MRFHSTVLLLLLHLQQLLLLLVEELAGWRRIKRIHGSRKHLHHPQVNQVTTTAVITI